MSDLFDRLKAAADAERNAETKVLLAAAAERIEQLNREHDAICEDRGALKVGFRVLYDAARRVKDRYDPESSSAYQSPEWTAVIAAARDVLERAKEQP